MFSNMNFKDFEIVSFSLFNKAVEIGSCFGTFSIASEQPVFTPKGKGFNRALSRVIIDA